MAIEESMGANSKVNEPPSELKKSLGLFDSTMIVVGSMIGSGIFIVSADIVRQVKSPAMLLLVWVLTGLLTIAAALCFSELAAAFPRAGGQYVFLRESLGPMWGFLYGWTMWMVIQTASIAAVAIAFAKFAGVVFPWFSASTWILKAGTFGPYSLFFGELGPYNVGLNTQNALAIFIIVLLTAINMFGVRFGALVQNAFTVTKILAVILLTVVGLFFASEIAIHANFENFFGGLRLWEMQAYEMGGATVWISGLTLVSVAMVGSLFAADAWYGITFAAGEVKRPERNLPLALLIGVSLVTLLYLTTNIAYLHVLPWSGAPDGNSPFLRGIQFASEDRVGTAVAEALFGPKSALIVAWAVMFSTFGCNNGLILSGARVFYAMARDNLFFKSAARVNRYHVPGFALGIQCIWSCLLCLSGSYGQLLDFIIFAVLLFFILTVVGLLVLRRRAPNLNRPYRVWGYPYLPIGYLFVAGFICVQLLRYKPQYTWPGLILVLIGIPIYFIWKRRVSNSQFNVQPRTE